MKIVIKLLFNNNLQSSFQKFQCVIFTRQVGYSRKSDLVYKPYLNIRILFIIGTFAA